MKKMFLAIAVFTLLASEAFSQITKENWINCEVSEENQGWVCGGVCNGENRILGKQGDKCAYEREYNNYDCSEKVAPTRTYTNCLFSKDDVSKITAKDVYDVNKIVAEELKQKSGICKTTKEELAIEKCYQIRNFELNSWYSFPYYIKDCKPKINKATTQALFLYEEIVGYDSGKCVVKSIEQIDGKIKQVECRLDSAKQEAFLHLGTKQRLGLRNSIKKIEDNKEDCIITYPETVPVNPNQESTEETGLAPVLK